MLTENEISKIVVNISFKIHQQYGPGLFESVMKKYFVTNGVKLEFPLQDK